MYFVLIAYLLSLIFVLQEMAWSDIPWSDPRWLDFRPLVYNAAENAEVSGPRDINGISELPLMYSG